MTTELPWIGEARKALAEAITEVGGQLELGKKLSPPPAEPIGQSTISYWLNFAKKGVPPQYVLPIEIMSGIEGLRHRLRPDVFPPDQMKQAG